MKILLVTGRIAHSNLKSEFSQYDILELPVDVASLIPYKMLKENLSNLKGYDGIIIPGNIIYDTSKLEKEINIPIRKGPIDNTDLKYVLEKISIDELDTKIPSDDILAGTECSAQYGGAVDTLIPSSPQRLKPSLFIR